MRRIVIASVSTIALALGGCSMFHHSNANESTAGYSTTPQSRAATAPTSHPTPQANNPGPQAQPSTAQQGSSTQSASLSRDELRQAQQKLKDKGDYKGAVDGKAGPQTAQAVKDFQKQNSLRQTGRLDQQTLSKLGVNTTEGSGSSMPPSGADTSSKADTNGK
jgi:peptidoglycan hydrolase-like protein with peptidoglycan-binding domain